jgi:NAD(P)-dependent dehydrogenase (short-subunit alcohol dehydrogenase family)
VRAGLRALVLGGSGAVGAEVVRGLCAAGVDTVLTFHSGAERAGALAAETGARPMAVDLRSPEAIAALVRSLDDVGAPSVLVHCAAVSHRKALGELCLSDWDDAVAVNCRAPFLVCQALAPRFAAAGEGHVVLVGALDRAQSLPLPVHFAGTQGMLPSLAMALAKELGPSGVRVNAVALGVLDAGLSRDLPEKARADYLRLSALRRIGTVQEAARAIVWLALHNRYMSGKVLAVNGGI